MSKIITNYWKRSLRVLQTSMLTFFCSICTAQSYEMDTIYIIDYSAVKCNGNNLSSRAFKNFGSHIRIGFSDSVFLKASPSDVRFKLYRKINPGYFYRTRCMSFQSLRIIKPIDDTLRIELNSQKRIVGSTISGTQIIELGIKEYRMPKWFANFVIIRNADPSHITFETPLRFANHFFSFNDNYKLPVVRNAIFQSVKYEYRIPERVLVHLK